MQGQGRPIMIAPLRQWCVAGRLLVLCFTTFLAGNAFPADQVTTSKQAGKEHERLVRQSLRDSFDKPFRFRFPDPNWPLVAAGQKGDLTVCVDSLKQYAGKTMTLQYKLFRIDDGAMIRREQTDIQLDANGSCAPVALQSEAPDREGVYEIQVRLFEDSDRIWSRLTGGPEKVALVQTPWLVHSTGQDSQSSRSGANADLAEFTWAPATSISKSNDDARESVSWIPQSATALVPSMRRDDGQWTINPWHSEGSGKSTPGESVAFFGKLPELPAHQLNRLTLSMESREKSSKTIQGFVEFSHLSDFRKVTRSVPFLLHRQLSADSLVVPTSLVEPKSADGLDAADAKNKSDANNKAASSDATYMLWHYGTGTEQFVRVRFEDPKQDVSVTNLEIARLATPNTGVKVTEGDVEPSVESRLDQPLSFASRQVVFDLGKSDWVAELTADYSRYLDELQLAEQPVSPVTSELFRLWKATRRITDMARWSGFNRLTIPLDADSITWFAHSSMAEMAQRSTQQQFTDSLRMAAMLRWNQGQPVSLMPKLAGRFAFALPGSSDDLPEQTRPDQSNAEKATAGHSADNPALSASMAFANQSEARLKQLIQDLEIDLTDGQVPADLVLDLSIHRLKTATVAQIMTDYPGRLWLIADAATLAALEESASTQGAFTIPPRLLERVLVCDADLETGRTEFGRNTNASRLLSTLFAKLTSDDHKPTVLTTPTLDYLAPRWILETQNTVLRLPTGMKAIAPAAVPYSDFVQVLSAENHAKNHVAFINQAPWHAQVNLGPLVQTKRPLFLKPSEIRHVDQSIKVGSISRQWHAKPVGGARTIAEVKNQLSEVIARLGKLAQPSDYDALANGGFEQQGQVGVIGWMHTQFPSDAVVQDSSEALEGERSMRLTTNPNMAGRTWLVSAPIDVPSSGRLAVSLSARSSIPTLASAPKQTPNRPFAQVTHLNPVASERKDDAQTPTQRVRVSLEGTRDGQAVRYAAEFEVPRDGLWQSRKIVMETDGLNPRTTQTVRLTIDSLSPGTLWIDDVHLHHKFATSQERAALQGKAFLAVQGLRNGKLLPAAKMLQNRWSGYLLNHNPDAWPSHRISETAHRSSRSSVAERSSTTPRNALPNRVLQSGNPDDTTKTRSTENGPSKDSSNNAASTTSQARSPARPGNSTTKRNVQTNPPSQSRRESMAKRLKSWLPRPLRF